MADKEEPFAVKDCTGSVEKAPTPVGKNAGKQNLV
jgi:hypothetical protein